MATSTKERLIFVVAVDTSEVENQPKLKAFRTQIEQDKAPLIQQIQEALKGKVTLAGKVELLTLDSYLNLFIGAIEVDAAIIKPAPQEKPDQEKLDWQLEDRFIQTLLMTIFSWRADEKAPRQSVWETPMVYRAAYQASDKRDVTWSFLRLNELCAQLPGLPSLLAGKGIGSRT